jgi:hypothetical protein
MIPTNPKAAQIVLEKLGHVAPTVHEVMDKAITSARGFFEDREIQIDPFLFPSLVRYEARLLFETDKYKAAGYRFTVLSNNGLLLVYEHERTNYRIRVRKSDEDGELPMPKNPSKTIVSFCRQPNLRLPGMELEDCEAFVCPDKLSLFIVWEVDAAYGLAKCDLICPEDEFGKYYFAEEIPHSATVITPQEEFDRDVQELDDIDIRPLKKTGTANGDDEEDS